MRQITSIARGRIVAVRKIYMEEIYMKKLLTTISLSLALILTSALPILASDSNINVTNIPSVKNTSANTIKVSKVTLNIRTAAINVGSTTILIPTVYPDTATNKNVTWKSSNTLVAVVNSTGNVYGRKAGTAVITSTTVDGKKKATCKVNVISPPPTITTASVLNNTITLTLSSPAIDDPTPVKSVIADFTVTASGVAVTPTAFSTIGTTGGVVTLTVPTVVSTDTDKSIVYSVSYKGGASVVANIQATDTEPISVKVGQNFNVIVNVSGSTAPEYSWAYTPNNDSIITDHLAYGIPYGGTGSILQVWTFHATQTGRFNVQFSRRGGLETLDNIVNVT